MTDKSHWYDGWFYDRCIAPNQDRLFAQIEPRIDHNSSVLDVGCGTGRLAFTLAKKAGQVLGIDLSLRNIERANYVLAAHPDSRISFEHRSIEEIAAGGKRHFDYAVMTYVIHEVPEQERTALLQKALAVADILIVGDYLVPSPPGLWSVLNELVEYVAGRDHYNNFKSFVAGGGLSGLAVRMHAEVLEELANAPHTSHLMVLQRRS